MSKVSKTIAIKEGWVLKQGAPPWRTWKKRWLVLTKSGLTYFKVTKEKPELKGSVPISLVVLVDVFDNRRKNAYVVETAARQYYFATRTEQEMKEWMTVIRALQEKTQNKQKDLAAELNRRYSTSLKKPEGAGSVRKAKQGTIRKRKRGRNKENGEGDPAELNSFESPSETDEDQHLLLDSHSPSSQHQETQHLVDDAKKSSSTSKLRSRPKKTRPRSKSEVRSKVGLSFVENSSESVDPKSNTADSKSITDKISAKTKTASAKIGKKRKGSKPSSLRKNRTDSLTRQEQAKEKKAEKEEKEKREKERETQLQLEKEKEREIQLQQEKEREIQLQLEKEKEMQLQLEKEKDHKKQNSPKLRRKKESTPRKSHSKKKGKRSKYDWSNDAGTMIVSPERIGTCEFKEYLIGLPSIDELREYPREELEKLNEMIEQQKMEEIKEKYEIYERVRGEIVEQLISKEIELVVDKFKNERNALRFEITSRGCVPD